MLFHLRLILLALFEPFSYNLFFVCSAEVYVWSQFSFESLSIVPDLEGYSMVIRPIGVASSCYYLEVSI